MKRPSVLVAVSPGALRAIAGMAGAEFDLVTVATVEDALERAEAGGIDVVLAGLHFDECSMMVLLDRLRASPRTRGIPVVCCRSLATLLPSASVLAARQVCAALGVHAFLDLLEMRRRSGDQITAQCLRDALHGACRSAAQRA